MSIVRLALDGSVTWALPPVSRQARKVSMVPKASSPFAARARAPFTWSRSQRSLVAEKYGSSTRPVRSRIQGSRPASLSRWQSCAVRRSCQTMARCSGASLRRLQSATVSRWLVMPTAATSFPETPARASARRSVETVESQISSRSCSTHPGFGKCWGNSWVTLPFTVSFLSRTRTVVPVVPWSMATTYFAMRHLLGMESRKLATSSASRSRSKSMATRWRLRGRTT